MHKRILKPIPFWRTPKVQDPTSEDYRRMSDDLPLLPGEWVYNIEAYELNLAEQLKREKNIAKLEKGCHPNQR